MPPRKKAKKPKIGFDCMADPLDKTFYNLLTTKPSHITAYGHITTTQKHLKSSFASSTKGKKRLPHRLPALCCPCHLCPWAASFQLILLLPLWLHEMPALCLFYRLPWKKLKNVAPWDITTMCRSSFHSKITE